MNTKNRLAAVAVVALMLVLVPLSQAPASDTGTVENLRAFARLYGYVRFFHPSDRAAEVDWEQFAVDGAATILEADGQEDLQRTLNRLFRRIAPTVRIVRSDEPPTWLLGSPQQVDRSRVVAWQHLGVGRGPSWGIYQSIRTNRPNYLPLPRDWNGAISQYLSSASSVEREIRLRTALRAEVSKSGSYGQLVLRYGGYNNWMAIESAPVTSPDWKEYEIVGRLRVSDFQVNVGAVLNGAGALRIDSYSLEIREPGGQWQEMPLTNPGFEAHPSQPVGWDTGMSEYTYVVDDNDAFEGSQSLEISCSALGEPAPEMLFDQVPMFGEKVLKDLGAGLWSVVPVALPIESVRRPQRRVLPGTGKHAHSAAVAKAATEDRATSTAERVAAVVIAWNIFQHFYPYFDVIDTDWDAELEAALTGALAAEDDSQFFRTLQLLLAALHDGHASARHVDLEIGRSNFPIAVEWIEDQVVVTQSLISEVQIGDVVVSVDGGSATAMIEDDMRYRSGTTQWKRRRSLWAFGYGDTGSTATVVVRRGDDELELVLERTNRQFLNEPRPRSIEEVEDGIYYVDLTQTSITEIQTRVVDLAAATGAVFDLRGYPAGNHDVIGYLIDESVLSPRWNRPKIIYPDQDQLVGWDTSGQWALDPLEPRFQGTPVFLTDDRAISYAESAMGIVEAYGIAEIVGRTTAGANGNVNPFTLPGGFEVWWTGMKVLKQDGSQHHLVGIIPTVPVERTIAAVREGRDEDLEMAIEIIRQRQSD